jgi:hypothetical protein
VDVETQDFYFMEMNTRLQVSSPLASLHKSCRHCVCRLVWLGVLCCVSDSWRVQHVQHAVNALLAMCLHAAVCWRTCCRYQ